MSRIQIITLGIVFLGFSHWVSSVAIGEGKPPNLILILADDVSADELSPYGGAISMPNLQKLADEGVLFRNTWATPVCAPSRAMRGFREKAGPGDVLIFTPELLSGTHYYARLFPGPNGRMTEESDRYAQARLYADIARRLFREASGE